MDKNLINKRGTKYQDIFLTATLNIKIELIIEQAIWKLTQSKCLTDPMKIAFLFKSFLYLMLLYSCHSTRVKARRQMPRGHSTSVLWVPGLNSGLLSLAESALTCWVILLDPYVFRVKDQRPNHGMVVSDGKKSSPDGYSTYLLLRQQTWRTLQKLMFDKYKYNPGPAVYEQSRNILNWLRIICRKWFSFG